MCVCAELEQSLTEEREQRDQEEEVRKEEHQQEVKQLQEKGQTAEEELQKAQAQVRTTLISTGEITAARSVIVKLVIQV